MPFICYISFLFFAQAAETTASYVASTFIRMYIIQKSIVQSHISAQRC